MVPSPLCGQKRRTDSLRHGHLCDYRPVLSHAMPASRQLCARAEMAQNKRTKSADARILPACLAGPSLFDLFFRRHRKVAWQWMVERHKYVAGTYAPLLQYHSRGTAFSMAVDAGSSWHRYL